MGIQQLILSIGRSSSTSYGVGDVPSASTANVSALSFTGTHTTMPVGIPAQITGNITIECLFRVSNVTNNNVLLEKAHTSHTAPFYLYNLVAGNGGQVRFDLTVAGTRNALVSASDLIVANEWYHLAGTYDGSTMRLYLNGILVASFSVSGAITSNGTTNLYIGSHGNLPSSTEGTAGQIDEVRIWNVARTQEQIVSYMDRSISSGATGLVAAWHFDENAGTTTADVTGTLSPATLTAGVTFYTTSLPYAGGSLSKSHLPGVFYSGTMPTYDGSAQSVHPDIIYIPGGAGVGTKTHWLAITPYPNGDAAYENPSILSSNDRYNFAVPSGLTNPIVTSGVSYDNSDNDILYYNGEFYLWYRQFTTGPDSETIFLKKSSDGVTWGTDTQCLQSLGTLGDLLSPSIVRIGSQFVMFSIKSGGTSGSLIEKRTSSDGTTWSAPSSSTTSGLSGSDYHWHLDVNVNPKNPARLDMLLATATSIGGGGALLYYGYSMNAGATWVVTGRLTTSLRAFESSLQYRATFYYDPADGDIFHIYYSGRTGSNIWRTAYLRRELISDQLYAVQTVL